MRWTRRVGKCLPVAAESVSNWNVDTAYLVGSLDEGQRYRGAYQPILG